MIFNSQFFIRSLIPSLLFALSLSSQSAELKEELIAWPAGCVVVLAEKAAHSTDEKKELTELAADLSRTLKTHGAGSPTWMRSNPDCCFWVELWSPGKNTFILQIEPNGARLTAGTLDSARKAVDFIKSKATDTGSSTSIPLGWYVYDGTEVKRVK